MRPQDPIRVGTVRSEDPSSPDDTGLATLSQVAILDSKSQLSILKIPAGSQLIDFKVDVIVPFGGEIFIYTVINNTPFYYHSRFPISAGVFGRSNIIYYPEDLALMTKLYPDVPGGRVGSVYIWGPAAAGGCAVVSVQYIQKYIKDLVPNAPAKHSPVELTGAAGALLPHGNSLHDPNYRPQGSGNTSTNGGAAGIVGDGTDRPPPFPVNPGTPPAPSAIPGIVPSPIGTPTTTPATPTPVTPTPAVPSGSNRTLWVSTTGSNSNGSGTSENPYATVLFASQIALPGDTIRVKSGTYTGGFTTVKSGTEENPIKYISDVYLGAKFIPQNNGSTVGWYQRGDNVIIDGFEFNGQGSIVDHWNVGIIGAGNNSTIQNCYVFDIGLSHEPDAISGGAGIASDGYYGAVNVNIINNKVNRIGPAGDDLWHGIYSQTSGEVYNNLIGNVSGWAINTWHDAHHVNISNNTIFNSNGGIRAGTGQYYHLKGVGDYFIVTNNIVYFCDKGVNEHSDGMYGFGPHNLFRNNLVFGWTTYDYNLNAGHVNDLYGDPLFVNYQSDGLGDYSLSEGSPAINSGFSGYAPDKDIIGTTRPRGDDFDLGAFEYIEDVVPSPVPVAPAPTPVVTPTPVPASSPTPTSPTPTAPSPVPSPVAPTPVPTAPSPVPSPVAPTPVPTAPSPVAPTPVPTAPSPVPTAPSPTPVPVPAGITFAQLNSDMTQNHESAVHGVPTSWSWGMSPDVGVGVAFPSDWSDPCAVPWGVIANAVSGSPATNVRVQFRKVTLDVKRNGLWSRVVNVTNDSQLDGALYLNYETNENAPANERNHGADGVSVKLPQSGGSYHWATSIARTPVARGPQEIVMVYEARLIVDNPSLPDDRHNAKLLACAGIDLWRSPTASWNPTTYSNDHIAIGRFKYLTNEWQVFSSHTLSGATEINDYLNMHGTPTPAPASPTPVPTVPPSPKPFGQDPGAYSLMTFQDEFSGSTLHNRWVDHIWYQSSDATKNYAQEDDTLKIWPQRNAQGLFIPRFMTTDGTFYQRYGFFEFEAKMPRGYGLRPTIWMMNHIGNNRPSIAFEFYCGAGNNGYEGWSDAQNRPLNFGASVYNADGTQAASQTSTVNLDLTSTFHKYGFRWDNTGVTFYFDGAQVGTKVTTSGLTDQMFFILDLNLGSVSGNPNSGTAPPDGKSNSLVVNYVRAWALTDGSTSYSG